MHRIPQRSYTEQSLEAWFRRLEQDWERWFDREALNRGRHYYRTEQVRSTELLDTSAIVHFKRGRESLYVIVDWEGDRPSFRQSDPALGPSLAVAGLYEVEEMLADEIAPIPMEAGKNSSGQNGHHNDPAPINRKINGKPEAKARPMWIQVECREDGLWLDCGFERDGNRRYGDFRLRDLNAAERELLIRYTAQAHRCQFVTVGREGRYRLQDPQAIARFIGTELRDWRRRFRMEVDRKIKAWEAGLKELNAEMQVDESDEGARFHWQFSGSHGSLFSDEMGDAFMRRPSGIHFIPGQGIYSFSEKTNALISDWKTIVGGSAISGDLPRYFIFAFLNRELTGVKLSEGMEHWHDQIKVRQRMAPLGADYLRSYQKEGVGWMHHLLENGCHLLLADEMGLGKTLQILQMLEQRSAMQDRKILIVCPASVVPVWQAEMRRFYPESPPLIINGSHTADKIESGVHLISYSQLRRQKNLFRDIDLDYTILDEAQSIKNPDAKVTHACFSLKSRYRVALTGTPMENRLLDLWTIFRFLMPGLLGNRAAFESRSKKDPEFLELIRKQVSPFILRRTKNKVVSDLPAKVEIAWKCPLTQQQKSTYKELVDKGLGDSKGKTARDLDNSQRMHLFSLLTRLRQVCCDPALLPGNQSDWRQSGKLESLLGRLEEAFSTGRKVVIFSQFVKFLNRIRFLVEEHFPQVSLHQLTGQTVRRDRVVDQFKETNKSACFLISLRAGGTGLNLQEADYVFLMDPWWNPAVEAQAIDRVHRIGQRKKVFVYRFITSGTIEDKIEALKDSKGEAFSKLLGDLDQPLDLVDHYKSLSNFLELEEENA